jgi:hypothetical protein
MTLISGLGCSSMMQKDSGAMPGVDLESARMAGYEVGPTGIETIVPVKSDKPSVVLQVNDRGRHMEQIPLPDDKPMFVGDVVEDAQLVEKLGRISLTILRPNPNGGPPIRLPVDFDAKGKRVVEGQNYSVREGDQIVVTPAKKGFLQGLIGPNALMSKVDM